MSLHNLIANGGKVVVIGGRMNPSWAQFENHPQFEFWTGDRHEIERHITNHENLPHNCKAIIVSRFISHTTMKKVIDEARRKQATIFGPKNDGEITRLLEQITVNDKPIPAPPRPQFEFVERKTVSKFPLSDMIRSEHKTDLPIADEARRLIKIAEERDIPTTFGSVAQAVGTYRKKLGIAVGPRAQKFANERKTGTVVPDTRKVQLHPGAKNDSNDVVKLIDDAIMALTLAKEAAQELLSGEDLKKKLRELLA
jgi:hypothetical protein